MNLPAAASKDEIQEESTASQSTADEEVKITIGAASTAEAVDAEEDTSAKQEDKKDNPYTFENLSMEKGEQVHLKDFTPLILQTWKDVKHPTSTLLSFGTQQVRQERLLVIRSGIMYSLKRIMVLNIATKSLT